MTDAPPVIAPASSSGIAGKILRGLAAVLLVLMRVTRGQPVARCGNSGNTSEPHLHLQVQDRTDFWAEDLKTFPILFRNVALVRGGRTQQLQKADVRRNDRIAAQNNRATS